MKKKILEAMLDNAFGKINELEKQLRRPPVLVIVVEITNPVTKKKAIINGVCIFDVNDRHVHVGDELVDIRGGLNGEKEVVKVLEKNGVLFMGNFKSPLYRYNIGKYWAVIS